MAAASADAEVLRVSDYLTAFRQVIPDLDGDLPKGATGRISVIGGSVEYTGAPYYAAVASLRGGGELASVHCAAEAAGAIKSSPYGPDLIVHPGFAALSSLDKARDTLCRAHGVVIGPGLGRSVEAEGVVRTVLEAATAGGGFPPLVVDADALFFLARNPHLAAMLSQESTHPDAQAARVFLTPNAVEMQRLCDAAGVSDARLLASALGSRVTVIQKGPVDRVTCRGAGGDKWSADVDAAGSRKRCGGQGDVLAGLTALFAGWVGRHLALTDAATVAATEALYVSAAVAASVTARRAGALAFHQRGRSMVASDVLEHCGPAVALLP
jgi:ATP-dependent NAD(P)H-hydrate dehydratase